MMEEEGREGEEKRNMGSGRTSSRTWRSKGSPGAGELGGREEGGRGDKENGRVVGRTKVYLRPSAIRLARAERQFGVSILCTRSTGHSGNHSCGPADAGITADVPLHRFRT